MLGWLSSGLSGSESTPGLSPCSFGSFQNHQEAGEQARWSRIPCLVLGPPISTSRTRSAPPGSFVIPSFTPGRSPGHGTVPLATFGQPSFLAHQPPFPHPGSEHPNALLAQPGLAGELRWGPVQPPQGRKSADMAFVREPPCTCHSHYSFGAGQWSPQNWSQTQRNDLL